jgi:hypothetical protein
LDLRLFNLCLLLGWLMVTGGVALEKGLGVGMATGGGLLMLMTLVVAYMGGVVAPKKPGAPGEGA